MTKEQRKLYNKESYEKNKEKIKEKQKKYYEKNKEKIDEKHKVYNKNNREKIKEQHKNYYENNREKVLEKNKKWGQTEAGKKSGRITKWKQRGVKNDDFESLYEVYINTKFCEECNVELVEGSFGNNKKVLDHDHETGLFRNVLCCGCNNKRR